MIKSDEPELHTCENTGVITRIGLRPSHENTVNEVVEILKIQNGVHRVNRNKYGIISVVLLPGFKTEEIANRESLGISRVRALFEKDCWSRLFTEFVTQ